MLYRSASWLAAIALVSSACSSEDDLYEEDSGYVDLVPAFPSPAGAANPNALLPATIAPTRGWINGQRVEYYDFGAVTLTRKANPTNAAGAALRVPDAAPAPPIYFFYDKQGRPLFSRPSFDPRSASWSMPGGKNVHAREPVAAPGAGTERSGYYSTPYVARPRPELSDPNRGTTSYQRPVIDSLLGSTGYLGLWEVVEITVNSSSYSPDDIKSANKVEAGLASGQLRQRKTGKVINCPVVDERTTVVPSALHNNIPRPRVEVWYRTKLGNCFLVNGWESIGETLDEAKSATDIANLRLFSAGEEPATRVSTIDVSSENVGNESAVRVSIPINKLFTPTIAVPLGPPSVERARTRMPGDDIALALPRHSAADAGGYSPLVWMWDLNVPQDPPYVAGTYRDAAALDVPPDPNPPTNPVLGGIAEARDGGTNVVTRNVAVIGAATPCKTDDECFFGQQCNPMPDPLLATSDPPAGKNRFDLPLNLADAVLQREGGPRCDVPAVGFGGYCASGVSRCDVQAAAGGANDTALKDLGVAAAGPTFTVHADRDAAKKKADDAAAALAAIDPMATPEALAAAEKAVTDTTAAVTKTQAVVDYYDGLGFTQDLNGRGYLCYPGTAAGPAGVGFCQIRCDASASSTNVDVKVSLAVPGTTAVDYTFKTEARCGGANMAGYRCLPSGTLPDRQRVCLRECNRMADPAPTLAFNSTLCEFPINTADGGKVKPFALSGDLQPVSQLLGQTCNLISVSSPGASATTVRACGWNPDFAPLDPAVLPLAP